MGQGRREIEAYVGHSEPLHELPWLQVLKSAPLTSPLPSSLPAPAALHTKWTEVGCLISVGDSTGSCSELTGIPLSVCSVTSGLEILTWNVVSIPHLKWQIIPSSKHTSSGQALHLLLFWAVKYSSGWWKMWECALLFSHCSLVSI